MDTTAASPGGRALQEFSFLDVRLGTVVGGEQGLLVMKSGELVAILTQLDEAQYSVKSGWFLETGFGRLGGCYRMFETLLEASNWIAGQLDADQPMVCQA
ncbi:hypothetical protein [Aminobacter sp. HY435]|uniref:hypothetical protein n=1 Tax=Aminobacter sp. HY435 TaxID=2970917 RepID=UPI0022B98CBA|nr:hypothetical protein [Aminobacter sp. HY435]